MKDGLKDLGCKAKLCGGAPSSADTPRGGAPHGASRSRPGPRSFCRTNLCGNCQRNHARRGRRSSRVRGAEDAKADIASCSTRGAKAIYGPASNAGINTLARHHPRLQYPRSDGTSRVSAAPLREHLRHDDDHKPFPHAATGTSSPDACAEDDSTSCREIQVEAQVQAGGTRAASRASLVRAVLVAEPTLDTDQLSTALATDSHAGTSGNHFGQRPSSRALTMLREPNGLTYRGTQANPRRSCVISGADALEAGRSQCTGGGLKDNEVKTELSHQLMGLAADGVTDPIEPREWALETLAGYR